MKELAIILVAATLGSLSFQVSTIAAEKSRKLSGSQIRARFTNMQVTDEVHFRDVYDRDGTLRSFVCISRNRTTDVMKCLSLESH